ncbi:MAG: hypothetical protein ACTSU5_10965 [Promethearchaeota archaeon]
MVEKVVKYRFRLAGSTGGGVEREIEVGDDLTVAEVKELVRREFGLSDVLDVHLVWTPGEDSGE